MLCMGFLMIVLDQTIVNVALPSIQRDLNFSQSGLAWVINAYLIAFGGLLPLLVGRLGDLIGRRPHLPQLASCCSHSPRLSAGSPANQGMLVGARFIQGRRRGDDLGGDPRDDRDDVPEAVPSWRDGDRRLRVRVAAAGGAHSAPARRWSTHPGDQLATWIFFVNLPIGVITLVARRCDCCPTTRAWASAQAPTSPARCCWSVR